MRKRLWRWGFNVIGPYSAAPVTLEALGSTAAELLGEAGPDSAAPRMPQQREGATYYRATGGLPFCVADQPRPLRNQ